MIKNRQSILLLGDILALVVSFCTMALLRFDIGAQGSRIWLQVALFGFLFALWLVVLYIFDLYNLRRVNPNPLNIGLLIGAMGVNIALGAILFYILPQSGISPKTNLAILSIAAFIFLTAWRRIFYILYTKTFTRSIGVIGTGPLITHLADELKRNEHFGALTAHWEHLPTAHDRVTLDLLIADNLDPKSLLTLSKELNTQVITLTQAYETLFGKFPISQMTDERALTLMTRQSLPAISFFTRSIEIIVASIVIILSSPFWIIAIIARLLEDGRPIFFNHPRVGKGGKIFTIYKIRSMVKNAEANGAAWAEHQDSRITRIGKILRKTHVDEIPQMLNILRGDIGLIGPRPERPEFVATLEQEIPYYYLRHIVRPGFTGWAQVKFRYARNVIESQEKFEYDLYYLANRSILLDIGIFLKTIQIIFTH